MAPKQSPVNGRRRESRRVHPVDRNHVNRQARSVAPYRLLQMTAQDAVLLPDPRIDASNGAECGKLAATKRFPRKGPEPSLDVVLLDWTAHEHHALLAQSPSDA